MFYDAFFADFKRKQMIYMENMKDKIETEIEALRKEANAGVQAYYSLSESHKLLAADKSLFDKIKAAPWFWATVFSALQSVYFLSMRKFFDPSDQSHRFEKLIKICDGNIGLFSKKSLSQRRQNDFSSSAELRAYVNKAFIPSGSFFNDFKNHVYQELDQLNFRQVYKTIADKVIAHNEVVRPHEIELLFEGTNTSEIEQILLLMERIATEFRSLWINGHKPNLLTVQLPLSKLVIDDVHKALR